MEKTAEEKNLNTQLSLYSDILSRERSIQYVLASSARQVFDLLNNNLTRNNDNINVTITKENLEKINALLYKMKDVSYFSGLSSSVGDYMQEIKIKEDILKQLK